MTHTLHSLLSLSSKPSGLNLPAAGTAVEKEEWVGRKKKKTHLYNCTEKGKIPQKNITANDYAPCQHLGTYGTEKCR